jgi:hypothetical protein
MGTKQLLDPVAQGRITRADLVEVRGAFSDGTRQARLKNFLFRIGCPVPRRFITHSLLNSTSY